MDDLRLLLPVANPSTVLEEMRWQLKNSWFDEVSLNALKRKLKKLVGQLHLKLSKKYSQF